MPPDSIDPPPVIRDTRCDASKKFGSFNGGLLLKRITKPATDLANLFQSRRKTSETQILSRQPPPWLTKAPSHLDAAPLKYRKLQNGTRTRWDVHDEQDKSPIDTASTRNTSIPRFVYSDDICLSCYHASLDRSPLDPVDLCLACQTPWQVWPRIFFSSLQEHGSPISPVVQPAPATTPTSTRKEKVVPPTQSRQAIAIAKDQTPSKTHQPPASDHSYTFGQAVQVLNINGHWYPASLVNIDGHKVKVHYQDWDDQDEWIIIGSQRLRPAPVTDTPAKPNDLESPSRAVQAPDLSDDDDGLSDFLDEQDSFVAGNPTPLIPEARKSDYVSSTLDTDPTQILNATDVLMTRRMVKQMVDEHGFRPNSFGYHYGRGVAVTYDTIGQDVQGGAKKRQQMEWIGYLREMKQDQVRVWFPDSKQTDWVRCGSRRIRVLTDKEHTDYCALGYDIHGDVDLKRASKKKPRPTKQASVPKKPKSKQPANSEEKESQAPASSAIDADGHLHAADGQPQQSSPAPTATSAAAAPDDSAYQTAPPAPTLKKRPDKKKRAPKKKTDSSVSPAPSTQNAPSIKPARAKPVSEPAPIPAYTTTGAFATRRAMRQLQDEHGFVPNPYGYEYNHPVEILNTRSSKHEYFWERGHLVAMKPGKVCVRYDGWAVEYDEWFMVGSRRIRLASHQPAGEVLDTNTPNPDPDPPLLSQSLSTAPAPENASASAEASQELFLLTELNAEVKDEIRHQRKRRILGPEDYHRLGMVVSVEELQAKEEARLRRKRKHLPDQPSSPNLAAADPTQMALTKKRSRANPSDEARKNIKRKRQPRAPWEQHDSDNASTTDPSSEEELEDEDQGCDEDQDAEIKHGFVANVYGYDYMQHVQVLHLDKKWYEARLLLLDRNRVKIHYCGWPDLFDEYVAIGSRRLQVIENDHEVECAESHFQQRYEDLVRNKKHNDPTKIAKKPARTPRPFKLRRWTLNDVNEGDSDEEEEITKVVCQECHVTIKQFRYYCTYCEATSEADEDDVHNQDCKKSFDLCLQCFDQNFPFWHEHPRSSFAVQPVINTDIGPRPIKGELVTVWEEDVVEQDSLQTQNPSESVPAASDSEPVEDEDRKSSKNQLEASQIFTGGDAVDRGQGYRFLKQWHRRKVCAFCNDDDDTSEDLGKFIGPFVITVVNKNGVMIKRTFWTHDACARYSPEVFCTPDGKWYNVTLALRRGRKVRCTGCKEKGATIGCFESKCHKSFHLPCAQKPVNYFKNGVIFWCPTHEAYYNKIDTYVNVFHCDGCNKNMENESWYSCVPCATSYFSSFDLCAECFDNFPEHHAHDKDHFEETSLEIIKEMEAQKATEAARAKEEIRENNAKARIRPKFLKRRRRRADGTLPVSCCYCGTQTADEWRKGYDGGVLMCAPCYDLALLVDNDGKKNHDAVDDDEEDQPGDSSNYFIYPPPSKDVYGMDLQDQYVSSIDDYTHKPYLTRDALSATKFSDSMTGPRLATYEPQPSQYFSLLFDSTYYDIPGRAPRWASHSGTDYHGTWLPQTVRRALLLYTRENERVLSNFLGRGTDAIECFLLKRRCCGIDINPAAVALSQRNCCFELPVGISEAKYRPIVAQADARRLSGSLFADESFHHILSHPPYKDCVAYSSHLEGDLSRFTNIDDFKEEYENVVKESWRLLKMGRRVTLGIGDNREHCYYIPVSFSLMRQYIDEGFELEELIVKRQRYCSAFGLGTYLCVQFDFLVFTHEFIATFRKIPKENVDRMVDITPTTEEKVAEKVMIKQTMHGIPPSAISRKSVVMGTVWIFKPNDKYSFSKLCISRMVERFGRDDSNWLHLDMDFLSADEAEPPQPSHTLTEVTAMDDENDEQPTISNYEMDRLKRIEENNRTLLQLGLISELSEESDDVIHYDTMMSKPVIADAPLWMMVCPHQTLKISQIKVYRESVVSMAKEACQRLSPKGLFVVGAQDIRDPDTGKLWPLTMLVLEDIERAVDRSVMKLKELVVAVPDGYSRDRKLTIADATTLYHQQNDFENMPVLVDDDANAVNAKQLHDHLPIVHAIYLIFQRL
ncbi:hypothetical protein DM01DRAFT_1409486 [Hesseltinella vesiculosa]|uniref:PHD-type domain-containing protein n=1 Tax=Hesseltinella vesiculosa TaxID=101127 RepID=A0A1X2GB01_9FUNG|nr:hypothetical protein DM01DRAFT_1409486 [Hesseltinella vesiculosa]